MKRKRKVGIVKQLKQAIEKSELTPYAIAQQSGISRAAISRFLSGERSLTLPAAEKICEVLGLELKPVSVDRQE